MRGAMVAHKALGFPYPCCKHRPGWCRGTLRPWPALAKLELLDLTANSLSGTLPPDFADPKQLKTLRLSANRLTGCAALMDRADGSRCMRCLGYPAHPCARESGGWANLL